MSKSDFMQQLSSGYSEGMIVETAEEVESGGEIHRIFGTYVFTDYSLLADFFSENYDEDMVRSGHGTRIVSFSLRQG